MSDTVKTQQLWIYINEGDSHHGRSLAQQIMEALREAGCPGALALRGIGGYGGHQVFHSELAVEVASHLPLVITTIDRAERIAQILPTLRGLVHDGMIAITPVEVVYVSQRERGPFPRHLVVGDMMSRDVAHVALAEPVSRVVSLLIERGLRALPVVDSGGHVVGMITDGDLLSRGARGLSLRLQRSLPPAERIAPAPDLQPQTAADLMSANPQTIGEHMPLAQAAAIMAGHNRKRMPVVDSAGRLVGMVSRYDLLKTVADRMRQNPAEALPMPEGAPACVGEMMLTGQATLGSTAPVAEVLDALVASPLRRVVILDAQGGVQGIITDGDLLRRAARPLAPGALGQLAAWLSARKGPAALQVEDTRVAAETMSSPVITVRSDAPVAEAISLMMAHRIKALPVLDAEGRLVGMVGRAGVLRALGGNM
jgi:CBS domain-containing protein/PII-like signaling protein